MGDVYVHGYDDRENERLRVQAGTLVTLLHRDTEYPPGSRVLEAGCGVGAQTVTLAERSPGAHFTSVDISDQSIAEAKRRVERAGLGNVAFRTADIFALPFRPESFDHVFLCFALEHLVRPVQALAVLGRLLREGGTITVIEGVRDAAIAADLIDAETFDAGVRALNRTTEDDGVFCYTFFKGVGKK